MATAVLIMAVIIKRSRIWSTVLVVMVYLSSSCDFLARLTISVPRIPSDCCEGVHSRGDWFVAASATA